MINRVVLL